MKLRGKVLFFGRASNSLEVILAILLVGWSSLVTSRASEPSPPDLLEVIVQNADAAAGTLTFETVVKSTLDATAELEIDDPAGTAKLHSGGGHTKRFTLRKGGEQSREQVQVQVKDKKPRTVRVRLRLLGADGQVWMIVEREVKVNQPSEAPGARQRVPVVRTLPDGTRMVEYITSQEAVARGLPAGGKPATPSPSPAANEKQEK